MTCFDSSTTNNIPTPSSFYFLSNINCIYDLDTVAYPEIADEMSTIRAWDRRSNAGGHR
ncbi:MAG: hypothetical protein IPN95_03580 [Bacteroidetes bacterium]|nr:hypothetical protein [Bacteroidota bacterium]